MEKINFTVKLLYIWDLDEYSDLRLHTSVRAFAKDNNCGVDVNNSNKFYTDEENLIILKIKHPGLFRVDDPGCNHPY
jgi:hypothetical protein